VHVWRGGPLFIDADLLYRYIMPAKEPVPARTPIPPPSAVWSACSWPRQWRCSWGSGIEHRVEEAQRVLGYGAAGVQLF
jgi:hypothetical protein